MNFAQQLREDERRKAQGWKEKGCFTPYLKNPTYSCIYIHVHICVCIYVCRYIEIYECVYEQVSLHICTCSTVL